MNIYNIFISSFRIIPVLWIINQKILKIDLAKRMVVKRE